MKTSKFLMAIMIGFLLLIVGCTKDEIKNEKVNKTESYLPAFIFEKDVFPPSPKGMIKVAGNDYEMSSGGFSWTKGDQVIETDALAPPKIAEHFQAIEVELNSEATIEIEQNPRLSLFLWEDEEKAISIPLNGNEMTMSENKGRHIYEVRAVWENGRISYTFVVEVR